MAERKLRTPRSLTEGDQDRVVFFDEMIRQIERLQATATTQAASIAALEARVTALENP